jgi:repressor LexA
LFLECQMLTERQLALFNVIVAHVKKTGVAPSYVEMRDALGRRSTSTVARLVVALEERGYVRRLKHRARAIEVIRPPDGTR